MSGFFGRKIIDPLPTSADINRRVSALEDREYERSAIANGALMIGGMIFKRGNNPRTFLFRPFGDTGFIGGTAAELGAHNAPVDLSEYQARLLRDWLLKEFPLETPKPDDKKPGGKK